MTVKELIEALKHCDEDQEVKFAYPSGDYWRTVIAGDINSIEDGLVVYSNYHQKMTVVDAEDEVGPHEVILLQS